MIPGPSKTLDVTEVAFVLRYFVRAIQARWPRVEIVIWRGLATTSAPTPSAGSSATASAMPAA